MVATTSMVHLCADGLCKAMAYALVRIAIVLPLIFAGPELFSVPNNWHMKEQS